MTRPVRRCLHPGCPELVTGSYCAAHQPPRHQRPATWGTIRKQVLDRDRHTCQRCGKTEHQLRHEGNVLEIHHADGDRDNNTLANLTALCKTPCHRSIAGPAARQARLKQTPLGKAQHARRQANLPPWMRDN